MYGNIVKVISRGVTGYAGILEEDNGMYFLVPDDKRVCIQIS